MDTKKAYEEIIKIFENKSDALYIDEASVGPAITGRDKASHKFSVGSLAILGGSAGLTGAPSLSALSALRSGAGVVRVICTKKLNPIFEAKLTEAMTVPVAGGDVLSSRAKKDIFDVMKKSSAFLVGPGLSVCRPVKKLVEAIIKNCRCPLILDADALNVISCDPSVLKKAVCPVIITPHIGEFARLCHVTSEYVMTNGESLAKEFCKEYGCITILKSHRTIVVTPDGKVYKNLLGNPGMATAGSGDVLSGVVASFASQQKGVLGAAIAGVFFHSLSADMACMELGEYSMVAGDIINYLPYAIKEVWDRQNQ